MERRSLAFYLVVGALIVSSWGLVLARELGAIQSLEVEALVQSE